MKQLEDELALSRMTAERSMEASRMEILKVLNTKERLESLCRELQKQKQTAFDESRRTAEDGENKRKALEKSYLGKLQEQEEEQKRLLRDNEALRKQFQTFKEQCQLRERHYAMQVKVKDSARLLAEAKLKQQTELCVQESVKGQAYLVQINDLVSVEKNLRTRIEHYSHRVAQMQEYLTASRTQNDDLTKAVQKLERDNDALRKKNKEYDVTLVTLTRENASLKQTNVKLEKLCRALQSRTSSTAASSQTSTGTTPAPTTTATAATAGGGGASTPSKQQPSSSSSDNSKKAVAT